MASFHLNLRELLKRHIKPSEEPPAAEFIKTLTETSSTVEAPFLLEKLLANSSNTSLKCQIDIYNLHLRQFEILYAELNEHLLTTQKYLEICLQHPIYKRLHPKFLREIKSLVRIKRKIYYLSTLCTHLTPRITYEFLIENHRVKYRLELFQDWLSRLNPPVDLKAEADYFRGAIDKIYTLLKTLRETVKMIESLESYL